MKLSYSVKNLRRLRETPSIEIRPLTILVGRNSAGKSTFLRSFPLLRQSIETKSSAPILWFGDFVDFGNFKSAVSDNNEESTIEFGFEFENFRSRAASRNMFRREFQSARRQNNYAVEKLRLAYGIGGKGDATVRKHIRVRDETLGAELKIFFRKGGTTADSILVDDVEVFEFLSDFNVYFPVDTLFGEHVFFRKKSEKSDDESEEEIRIRPQWWVFTNLVKGELAKYVDGRTSDKRLRSEAIRVLRRGSLSTRDLRRLSEAETKTFQNIYKKMLSSKNNPLRQKLDLLCRANYLMGLLEAAGGILEDYFGSVEYIGPARARNERFYRQQELEVSEISPDGKNLPMFLASLAGYELEDFSEWVQRVFGYGVDIQKSGGHISITLKQSGRAVNVVDTGYGVSQVLPVLAQLWWMRHKKRRPRHLRRGVSFRRQTLAIEQPELHLHPAHQALLADVFAESIEGTRSDFRMQHQYLVVETHSEAMINRVGELIEKKQLKADHVQIIVFGDDPNGIDTGDIQLATFSRSGALRHWPFGFFNY